MGSELRQHQEGRGALNQAKGKNQVRTEDVGLDGKEPHRFLDRDDLHARGIRFSRGHLHRLMKSGKFPRPVKIGLNKNGWVESEVEAWITARVAERDAAA